MRSYNADSISDEDLRTILECVRPETEAAHYATLALEEPGVRHFRKECARILNDVLGMYQS